MPTTPVNYQCREQTPGNYACTTDFYSMCTPDAPGVACVTTYHQPVCKNQSGDVIRCPRRGRGQPPLTPTETKPVLEVTLHDSYTGTPFGVFEELKNLKITGSPGGPVTYEFPDSDYVSKVTLSKLHDMNFKV